jgi:hypothetical protein
MRKRAAAYQRAAETGTAVQLRPSMIESLRHWYRRLLSQTAEDRRSAAEADGAEEPERVQWHLTSDERELADPAAPPASPPAAGA